MTDNHRLARAYIEAVTAGDLPDSLLTEDMTAWLITEGALSKSIIEAHSWGRLIDGNDYEQIYAFVLRVREGPIAHIAEHYNVAIVQEKLLPLVAQMLKKDDAP